MIKAVYGNRQRIGWQLSKTIDLPGKSCAGCPLEGRCPGDCPGRLHYNRNEHPELICELYRTLYAHQSAENADAGGFRFGIYPEETNAV